MKFRSLHTWPVLLLRHLLLVLAYGWLLAPLDMRILARPDSTHDRKLKIAEFAARHGLDKDELISAVESVIERGKLPERWITKLQARQLGWQPGSDLGRVAPGKSIGGDRFGNREGRLTDKPGRRWYEADLMYKNGRRNARRLLYSSDRLFFVTLDHYRTFRRLLP